VQRRDEISSVADGFRYVSGEDEGSKKIGYICVDAAKDVNP